MHKGVKCPEVSSGCVYISRDIGRLMKVSFHLPFFILMLVLNFTKISFYSILHFAILSKEVNLWMNFH